MKAITNVYISTPFEDLVQEQSIVIAKLIKMNYHPYSGTGVDNTSNAPQKKFLDSEYIIFIIGDASGDISSISDYINALKYSKKIIFLVKSSNSIYLNQISNFQFSIWDDLRSLKLIIDKLFSAPKQWNIIPKYLRRFLIQLFSIIILTIFLIVFRSSKFNISYDFNLALQFAVIATITSLALFSMSSMFYHYFDSKKNKENETKSEYRQYLTYKLHNEEFDEFQKPTPKYELKITKKAEQNIGKSESDKNIIALMLKNTDETTEYFSISKKQAKSSYKFSIFACSVGIVILVISVVFAFIFDRIEPAILAAISGAITELIAGTVLWVHNKSALQLNHYYDALHENEKFLSAINIADKISEDKRDEVLFEIIKMQLHMTVDISDK